MPPKLTAEEIEARDAARLNQLGYKQVETDLQKSRSTLLTMHIGIKT